MFKICKNEHYSKEKNFYKCDQCNLLMCDNCQFEHGEQNQSHFVQNCGSISDPSNQQNTEELETSVNLDLSLIINGQNQAISPKNLNQNKNEEHKNTNQVGTSSTSETNERKNFSNINKIQSNASIKTNVQQQSKNKIRPNNLIFSSNNKSDKMQVESRDNSIDNLDLILEESENFDIPNKSHQNGIQNIQVFQQGQNDNKLNNSNVNNIINNNTFKINLGSKQSTVKSINGINEKQSSNGQSSISNQGFKINNSNNNFLNLSNNNTTNFQHINNNNKIKISNNKENEKNKQQINFNQLSNSNLSNSNISNSNQQQISQFSFNNQQNSLNNQQKSNFSNASNNNLINNNNLFAKRLNINNDGKMNEEQIKRFSEQHKNYVNQNQDKYLNQNEQVQFQNEIDQILKTEFERAKKLRDTFEIHKQQEEKRFMQFKKILLQSVEGFLSEIKRSFNNIFVQKRQHIKQITEILEGFQQKRLVPIVLREDKNEIQQQLLKMKEQFNIVNNFTTNLPNFLIKTEYMSEIKQKLISFIQISDKTTKQWPQIQKLGQNANQIHKLPFYYPENNSIVLYDVIKQQQMIENMQNEENEIFLDQLPVHCQPIYHQTQHENKIFLIGGMEYCEQKNCYLPSKKNFVYDINSKKLTRIADSLIEKTKACTVKINDIIYQFGGVITHNRIRAQTCEKYLINEDKWESITPMGQIRVMGQCCYIQNLQRIYIFGGITDEKQIQRNVEYYDIKNNKWQEVIIKNKLSYVGKHSGFAVNSYSKNEILLIGGFSFCQTHRSKGVQLFNINTNEITDMGDILPVGVAKDGRSSDPIIYNNELLLLNSIQSQIYDQVQQRNNEFITLAINSLRAQITDISKIQISE